MDNKRELLLNEYLERKCRIKPLGVVKWETEECFDCGNSSYSPVIDGFDCGIRITDGDLVTYLIDKKMTIDTVYSVVESVDKQYKVI